MSNQTQPPPGARDAVIWRAPNETPSVGVGDDCYAIVAVRRKGGDKVYSFPAQYLNRKELLSENPRDTSGNGWSQSVADANADFDIHATGWFCESSTPDGEYDVQYEAVLSEGDELIAWAEIPQFTLTGKADGGEFLPQLPCAYCPPPGVNESERCDDCQFGKATQPAVPGAGDVDGMLPDALAPYAKEWYRLCERRFSVERMTISGELAEAIVEAMGRPRIKEPNTAATGLGDATSLRELAEVLDVPEGYEVAEFLPGLWHYKYDDDGLLMASGTTWNHPALAATAAWKAALAAQPAPVDGMCYCQEGVVCPTCERAQPAPMVGGVEDWVTAPKDPTEEMIQRGLLLGDTPNHVTIVYQSMLAAAPKPSALLAARPGGDAVELETAARKLYNASQGDAHNLHTLAWDELRPDQRVEWRKKAKAHPAQAGGEVES